jgi:hypothetical protein
MLGAIASELDYLRRKAQRAIWIPTVGNPAFWYRGFEWFDRFRTTKMENIKQGAMIMM